MTKITNMPKIKKAIPRPMHSRILVLPTPPDEFTESGLVIPASAQAQQSIGKIVAVGADVKSLLIGDEIVYGKYAGALVELESVEYIVLKEEDVLLRL